MKSIRGLRVIRSGIGTPILRAARVEDEEVVEEEAGSDAPGDGRLATLEVDFSRFDTWYEIDSWREGRFLERVRPGSFKRTIDRGGLARVKVLFNHGFDFSIGDKVLGVPEVLEERKDSPRLEAGLLDTSYNRDLLPGLRAGAYGSSFMFEVLSEEWNHEPERSEYNPDGLPERSVTEVTLFEAGPVTWPANDEATSGVRSGTDWMIERAQQRADDQADDLVRSLAGFRAMHGLRTPLDEGFATPVQPVPGSTASAPDLASARHLDGLTSHQRAARLRELDRPFLSAEEAS